MDAIEFHSKKSKQFDQHYYNKSLFDERFNVWTTLINNYLKDSAITLDAGCGSGIFSYYIAEKGNKVIAIDGSDEMINLCKEKSSKHKKLNVQFLVEKLPFNEESSFGMFDFIISSSVLEYVSEYEHCLNDFKNHLNDNGVLIISLPNKNSIYRKIEKIIYTLSKRPRYLKYVKNMSTIKDLNEVMVSNGFEVLENRLYSSDNYLEKVLKYLLISKKYRSSLFAGVYKKKPNQMVHSL